MLAATGRPARAACTTSICVGSSTACTISGNNTVDDDCVLDFRPKDVTLTGSLKTASDGQNFTVYTDDFEVQGTVQARGAPLATPLVISADGFFKTRTVSNSASTVDVGNGGNVTVTAGGLVSIDGKDFTADGGGGTASAGDITITAATTFASTKAIHATGASAGDGGSISLTSTSGNMTIGHDLLANGTGSFAFGGSITLDSGGTLTVSKRLQAQGDTDGDGGSISAVAAGAATFNDAVRTTGGTEGAGGDIAVTAPSVTIKNAWNTSGGSDSDGGDVDVTATNGAIDLQTAGGSSGAITTDGGNGGSGGDVTFAATGGVITQSGPIASNGSGGWDGGSVSLTSNQSVTSSANITATGSGDCSFGGAIDLIGGTNHTVTVNNILDARSVTTNGCLDGDIHLEACSVSVSTGTLKTRNTSVGAGSNLVVYKNTYTLGASGSMLSDDPAASSCATLTSNFIKCRCVDANNDSVCDTPEACVNNPTLSGTVTPTALVCKVPLPACQ